MHRWLSLGFALLLLPACGDTFGGDRADGELTNTRASDGSRNFDYESKPDLDPNAQCGSNDLEAAYEATDRSIHELITCGGMQVRLARSMVGLLLLSNDRMFDDKTREDLEAFEDFLPRNEFEQTDKGVWRLPMGSGSTFDVAIHEPKTGDLLTHDVFDMETYLVGLEATYEMTFEEMWNEPDRRNSWTFTWDEPGPLVHLLNGGEPVPREFVLEMSLNEILFLLYPAGDAFPDVGPFSSLFDLEMSSTIDLHDARRVWQGTAEVDYDVRIVRQRVGDIVSSAGLQFDVRQLTATVRDRRMTSTRADLSYGGGVGVLQGAVELESQGDRVLVDFGDGAAYPEPRWTCD